MIRSWLFLVAAAIPLFGQQSITRNLTALSTDCSVQGACAILTWGIEDGIATVVTRLTGTFTATVQWEGTLDGDTWVAIKGSPIAGGAKASTSASPGTWMFSVAGLVGFRARASAWTSAPTVIINATKAMVTSQDTVSGMTATGSTLTGNPLPIAGTDSSNIVRSIGTSSSGILSVGVNITAGEPYTAANVFVPSTSAGSNGPWAIVNYVWGSDGWNRYLGCRATAAINVTAAATTEIVALTSSQTIRVCSFLITGSAANTSATFVYGTGTNCASGQVALTGAMLMNQSQWIASPAAGGGQQFATAASNALCLTAATGNVTGYLTYAKY